MEQAIFAAGCFWGIEDAFMKMKGVTDTEVGYTGGHTKNPTYKDVCGGGTGHAEAVRFTYDPAIVSYKELLDIFWNIHNPTQFERQGPDMGNQYRGVIFFQNEKEHKEAEESKNRNGSIAWNHFSSNIQVYGIHNKPQYPSCPWSSGRTAEERIQYANRRAALRLQPERCCEVARQSKETRVRSNTYAVV